MSSRLDGFNRIARFYDPLKRMVFGNAIHQSEVRFLDVIPPAGNILIVAGGSGEILESLIRAGFPGHIWFVEASSAMLEMAKKRLPAELCGNVTFVHGTERNLPEDVVFDAVITNFFFDLFPDHRVLEICASIASSLCSGGVWLVTDFVNDGSRWQRLLLGLMYRFFAFVSSIEGRELPDWQRQLRLIGMRETASAFFLGGFVKSAVFQNDVSGID